MNNCLFCKISSGEIPAVKVYEDDEIIAFLDIRPINPGHTLVVPKEHYETLTDLPDDLACNLMRTVPSLAKAVMKAADAKGFNLGCNNGMVAGQSVPHVHLHIMPRHEGDGYQAWHGEKEQTPEELNNMANKIRQNIS